MREKVAAAEALIRRRLTYAWPVPWIVSGEPMPLASSFSAARRLGRYRRRATAGERERTDSTRAQFCWPANDLVRLANRRLTGSPPPISLTLVKRRSRNGFKCPR